MNLGSGHTWRGPSEALDPWRDWIRENIKEGTKGYVFEDIDLTGTSKDLRGEDCDKDPVPWLVARRFRPGKDPVGKLMAIEKKFGDADMDYAQKRTFGLWDHLTRLGDPQREHWMGWYLLNHPHEDPRECTYVTINGKILTMDEFKLFLKFELDIPPYEFPDYIKI